MKLYDVKQVCRVALSFAEFLKPFIWWSSHYNEIDYQIISVEIVSISVSKLWNFAILHIFAEFCYAFISSKRSVFYYLKKVKVKTLP